MRKPQREGLEIEILESAILEALSRIRRALGSQRAHNCRQLILRGFDTQREHGDFELHRDWIRFLMVEYYDPYYARHLERVKETIEQILPPNTTDRPGSSPRPE